MLLHPAAECKMLQLQSYPKGDAVSPGMAGLSQGLAVLPAPYHAELAPAELPLCLYANFRHMFQITAELHIIFQHWQLPSLHHAAEMYA